MESTIAPHTGRLDRHVRRSVLRVGDGVSRHRIAYSLEEALRLAALPGEEEGRIYCFRRVSLSGIQAEANRRVWMEQVQRVLGALAVQAVHAGDPGAGAANAVYFDNIEQALETLLRKAVRATGGGRFATPEWFANSAIGVAPEASYAAQIPAIIERIRPPSMAPAAAAAIVFAALRDADPVPFLSALPAAALREWVREIDAQTSRSPAALPLQLPGDVKIALERAASHFGWKDPATIWLAAQAVLLLSPSAWNSGTVAKRARATLRLLEDERFQDSRNRDSAQAREAAPALVFDDDQTGAPERPSLEVEPSSPATQDELKHSHRHTQAADQISVDSATVAEETSAESDSPVIEHRELQVAKPPLLGQATQAAGLHFLLNVLRLLGIAAALDACPALAEAGFAIHMQRKLATEAGVAEDDPILLCLPLPQPAFNLPEEILATLPLQPEAWPKGFAASRCLNFNSDYFLRVWTVAAKRWLWRMGRLTLREVVNRHGRVWLTRTDIDVTFPLAAADLRIRRMGLDIDPGWLPWLGEFGRVVRFHYRDRSPEETQ